MRTDPAFVPIIIIIISFVSSTYWAFFLPHLIHFVDVFFCAFYFPFFWFKRMYYGQLVALCSFTIGWFWVGHRF